MNKYVVCVLELYQSEIEVEANDENEAIFEAENCNGKWLRTREFVETADTNTWTVELIESNEEPDPTDREAYALFKIRELRSYASKADNESFVDIINQGLEELEEELTIIRTQKEE